MRAVIAIDSLKGSLSSIEAGQAIAEGIRKADAKADVVIRPLADGGEGTVEALVCGMNGTLQHVKVTGHWVSRLSVSTALLLRQRPQ